jgi:hypothetical protein
MVVQNGHFNRTLQNQDHLFVNVVMGSMRHLAGSQLGDVQLYRNSGMGRAFQHRPHAIPSAAPHRQILEAENLGWQR